MTGLYKKILGHFLLAGLLLLSIALVCSDGSWFPVANIIGILLFMVFALIVSQDHEN